MCVIVNYACQHCMQETGQRDYVRHNDGQRFHIPDSEMEIVSFCTEISPLRVIIWLPSLQTKSFPCKNEACLGMKTVYNEDKYKDEEGRIIGLLGATAEIIASEGRSNNNVEEMLEEMGISPDDLQELPNAKIEKWTGLAADKLKMVIDTGETMDEVREALQAMTGFKYTENAVYGKGNILGVKRSHYGMIKTPLREDNES
ncbi:hypothetical protein Daus18300_005719 [Diaporthe australafricana]|uniref:Uncharacterized protein n=1 Tax=Diaporthe australafricana TaxID=127596 RepID=A0ABR3WZ36_9PEZI